MSDLISRSALIDALKIHFDSCFREDGELLYSDHICTSEDVVDLIKLVENQPTAYDIDKVVEELKKELSLAKKEKEKCTGENHLQFYSTKGYAGGISYAIEVVKQGSVSDYPKGE